MVAVVPAIALLPIILWLKKPDAQEGAAHSGFVIHKAPARFNTRNITHDLVGLNIVILCCEYER